MNLDYKKIRYKNDYYAVVSIESIPVVLDWDDFRVVKSLEKSFRYCSNGFISCYHTVKVIPKEVYLHEIIMGLKQRVESKKAQDIPIIHVNRIGLDNRRDNLLYDTADKKIKKNNKKKKRIIKLPEESGIDENDIPTYVWYMRPNGKHGDRFMVQIGDVSWKTTSSRDYSLKYKLEEAKKYIRELKETNPVLFEEYSMNGDYTKQGLELLKSYYKIISRAGFKAYANEKFNKNTFTNNTKKLVKKKRAKN